MNGMWKAFTWMGEVLVNKLGLDKPGRGKSGLQQDIISLAGGKKAAVRNYYIRKMAIFLMILTIGLAISGAGLFLYLINDHEIALEQLARPGYGEGDRKEELNVKLEGEADARQLAVTVQERKYTEQEESILLEQAVEELKLVVRGDNQSMDEVRLPLNFPESMAEGAVKISWMTMPYGIISGTGAILHPEDSGTLVEIRATLTCGKQEVYHTMYTNVYPPELSEEEQLWQSIQKEVEQADAKDSHKETLILPENLNGKGLTWTKTEENPFWTLLILSLIGGLGVYLEMDSKTHERAEARKKQLMLDYPDLMWKMTMLLGAGLSIKGAFTRISEEYLREQKGHSKKGGGITNKAKTRYVYEEVSYTCYEMQSGIAEAQAYERFGRRCQLPEYIRMGSVLSQNLKKGAKGLTALLQAEAESSLNERKNHARKIGEQAGTKLLLPMVLMLAVVLVILMVPAFLSF